jgi:hypothetical protein
MRFAKCAPLVGAIFLAAPALADETRAVQPCGITATAAGKIATASAGQPESNGNVTTASSAPEGNGNVTTASAVKGGSGVTSSAQDEQDRRRSQFTTASADKPEGSGNVTSASANPDTPANPNTLPSGCK